MADSFWTIPEAAAIRTPLIILREQAAALTQQTHGVLVGEASAKPRGEEIAVSLDIVVPGLNDYRYRVVSYQHPLEMYPGRLSVHGSSVAGTITDEAKFVDAIRQVLSSQKMQNVLTSLLAQVSEA